MFENKFFMSLKTRYEVNYNNKLQAKLEASNKKCNKYIHDEYTKDELVTFLNVLEEKKNSYTTPDNNINKDINSLKNIINCYDNQSLTGLHISEMADIYRKHYDTLSEFNKGNKI